MLGNAPLSSTGISDLLTFVASSSGAITISINVAGAGTFILPRASTGSIVISIAVSAISHITPTTGAGHITISIGVAGRLQARSISAAQITISIAIAAKAAPPKTQARALIQLFLTVAGASRIVVPSGAGRIVVRITVLAGGRALAKRPLPFDWQGSFSHSPWQKMPPPSSIGYSPYVQAISYSPETGQGYVAFRDGTAAVYVMSLSQYISLRYLVGSGADPRGYLATLQSVVTGNV